MLYIFLIYETFKDEEYFQPKRPLTYQIKLQKKYLEEDPIKKSRAGKLKTEEISKGNFMHNHSDAEGYFVVPKLAAVSCLLSQSHYRDNWLIRAAPTQRINNTIIHYNVWTINKHNLYGLVAINCAGWTIKV